VAMLCSMRPTFKREVYMARLFLRPLYNFALVLALCVSVGIAVFLLSHSQYWSAPQAAEIPSPSGHTGELPPLW
jgi:hypothetical protein